MVAKSRTSGQTKPLHCNVSNRVEVVGHTPKLHLRVNCRPHLTPLSPYGLSKMVHFDKKTPKNYDFAQIANIGPDGTIALQCVKPRGSRRPHTELTSEGQWQTPLDPLSPCGLSKGAPFSLKSGNLCKSRTSGQTRPLHCTLWNHSKLQPHTSAQVPHWFWVPHIAPFGRTRSLKMKHIFQKKFFSKHTKLEELDHFKTFFFCNFFEKSLPLKIFKIFFSFLSRCQNREHRCSRYRYSAICESTCKLRSKH